MSSEIIMKPIGVISSPRKDVSDNVPIQGALDPESEGVIRIYPEFSEGLRDLDGFSHLIVIYAFHRCHGSRLTVRPYMDTEEHGVFATRSPHRPNHIGLTVTRIIAIENNYIHISGIDVIDGTPVLDIKPYMPSFDSIPDARSGWAEKYIAGNHKPVSTVTRSNAEWNHGRE